MSTEQDQERWIVLGEFPDYAVSSLGRVRRETPGGNATKVGKILSQALSRGYPTVGLASCGRMRSVSVHRLVCSAFHGPKPTPSHQVAHNDGNRANNKPENLRWASSKENHADRFNHGTNPAGTRNGRAILNESAVREIRQAARRRGVCLELAQKFGCSIGTINIVRQVNSPVWTGV